MSTEGPKAFPVVYDSNNGLQYSFQSGYIAIPVGIVAGSVVPASISPDTTLDFVFPGPIFTVGSDALGNLDLQMRSATGVDQSISFWKGGVQRWSLNPDLNTTEFSIQDEANGLEVARFNSFDNANKLGTALNQLVVVSGLGSNPDASAIVDIQSTTKGFKPPVMTTTQKNAIATPIEGLVVYDATLHKLCVHTDSAWETITSA